MNEELYRCSLFASLFHRLNGNGTFHKTETICCKKNYTSNKKQMCIKMVLQAYIIAADIDR